jgi:thiamine kinase-like enzyme
VTAQPTCAAPDTTSLDSPDVPDVLDVALAQLPEFRDADREITPLPGGLTNRIYKVNAAAGRTVVARVSTGKSSLLAIDRVAECRNAVAAAQRGAGPRVLLCDPAAGVSIVDWIDGRTFTDADLADSTALARVAANCRRLHAGPRFGNDFDMFEVQQRYLTAVLEHGFRLPAGYRSYAGAVERIQAALAVQPEPTVACHNDLLAANIMDSAGRIWFIDYEYSGNNDPCFELGNIWSEANLHTDALAELVAAYYGTASRARVARARLLALMSKYGWTLWGSIQDGVSDVEFDFWAWGMEKYDRAVAEFDGPEFAQLIDDVQKPI